MLPVLRRIFLRDRYVRQSRNCFTKSITDRQFTPREVKPNEIHEPIFEKEHVFPFYPPLSLVLTGPDYAVLEKFQKYSHKVCLMLDFDVSQSCAYPCSTKKVVLFKRGTSAAVDSFTYSTYERALVLDDVETPYLPILINMLTTHLPMSVQLNIQIHNEVDDDRRYVPDYELLILQRELKSLDDPRVRAKKGWLPLGKEQ